jgi:hypothetical protein
MERSVKHPTDKSSSVGPRFKYLVGTQRKFPYHGAIKSAGDEQGLLRKPLRAYLKSGKSKAKVLARKVIADAVSASRPDEARSGCHLYAGRA